jgi:putative ABC transport system permease protein
MYALKILWRQPLRFILTVFGVALCVVLMLFLVAVYKGVADGSVEYVRASDADLWVMQRHCANILRSTSLLPVGYGNTLSGIAGVESCSPILFILAGLETAKGYQTLYLTGYVPESGRGGPPEIVRGRPVGKDDEAVLDRSFAAKCGISVGDEIRIQEDRLRVVGLSGGTNMFVIQYAFVTLARAQRVAGFPGIVSCYQIKVKPGWKASAMAGRIRAMLPGTAVYDRDVFLKNNIREMESGFLPLLFMVAAIGAVVLSAILSLMLSVHVLEQRGDFAVMKAVGSPKGTIAGLVVQQSLVFAGAGIAAAVALFFPLELVVEKVSPEVSAVTSFQQMVLVGCGVVVISLISSILPVHRLRSIYPMEVFR